MPGTLAKATVLTSAEEAVLSAFCYADCFDFPLALDEIFTYMPFETLSQSHLAHAVERLVRVGKLDQKEDLYFLPGRDHLVGRRREKEPIVAKKWEDLRRYLPPLLSPAWVKGALLTGSLAAKNPSPKADADLLLILDHRRMWVGYLFLRIWFRFQKKIEFCPNYVISNRSLKLMFPNLFTAIEFSMAIPLKSGKIIQAFETGNPWTRSFIPNAKNMAAKGVKLPSGRSAWITACSWFVASPLGFLLDRLEYWRLRWRTRGQYLPKHTVYKPHPPTRQYFIFRALLNRLDRCRLKAPKLRAHLAEQNRILKDAIRAWGLDPTRLAGPVKENVSESISGRPLKPMIAKKAN